MVVPLLSLVAVGLIVAGIVQLARGAVAFGVMLVLVGLLIGPGGISLAR